MQACATSLLTVPHARKPDLKLPTVKLIPCVLAGFGVWCAAGCGHHAAREAVQTLPAASPPKASTTEPPAPLVPQKTGIIYTASQSGGDDNNLVAHTVRLAHSQSPARDALEALIQADHSPIPEGTRLRSIKVVDGLATVDLSGEFQAHFHGSETEEAQTVNSVLRTLGQFSSIDRVQFLMDGKPIDALSQLPLSGPLDVIRPNAAAGRGDARG